MQHDTPAHETLWDLIKDIRFGMFTHRNAAGMLHAHPLTTQNKSVDEGATLYFFAPRDGEIVGAIAQDAQVSVSYADPGDDSYVSVSGEARVDENQAKKDELLRSCEASHERNKANSTFMRSRHDAGRRLRSRPSPRRSDHLLDFA